MSEQGQVVQTDARGQRAATRQAEARQAAGKPAENPAITAAKRLALSVGLCVLVIFLGSCAAGYAIVQSGSGGVLASLRNIGLLVLAPIYLLQALFWVGVYFGLAWAVGAFGPKVPVALRWTADKVALVDTHVGRIADRFIVRPLAGTVRRTTQARTLVSRLSTDVDTGITPVRRWSRELSDWPTLQHRLRRGRTPLPPAAGEASAAGPAGPAGPAASPPAAGEGAARAAGAGGVEGER
ncbi:MAG TPA: hypothetical protein VNK05_17140 [Chloroflexota bacterium]|nr:hypothetical protein [Chloroflexota bacterium]